MLPDHGAILIEYVGGTKAQVALRRKDFKRFVNIQLGDESFEDYDAHAD
jgi:hypothetical protein